MTDDPMEEPDDLPPSLEEWTLQTIAKIKDVDPANAEHLERHLGDLLVNDLGLFTQHLSLVPKEYRRAAAYLAVQEVGRVLSEIDHACQFFSRAT